MKDLELGILMFLQLGIILATCRVVGWLGRKFLGQTQVVGEMIAGVCLGPSLFGLVAPEISKSVFPLATESGRHPSIQILYAMSQVGLSLYMFLVGAEFDLNLLKARAKGAALVSISGIIAPFVCGVAVAWMIHDDQVFFPKNIDFMGSAIYMGAAMCITAFPMLARIIREKGIAGTSMGTLALGAGAFDDMFAWSLLAVVLAMTKGDANLAYIAFGGALAYVVVVFGMIKPFLFVPLAKRVDAEGKLSPDVFAIVLVTVMLGSWFTDAIGIYAVFGAFLCGAALPKGKIVDELIKGIEPLTVSLLLPLFFVFSGLNTRIDLLNTPHMWGVAALATFAAILGKGGACFLAARMSGEPMRESLAIGTLMNARGLMELIILNIGLQAGVITPELFTVMVIMAIVTTLMASPIFEWVYGKYVDKEKSAVDASAAT